MTKGATVVEKLGKAKKTREAVLAARKPEEARKLEGTRGMEEIVLVIKEPKRARRTKKLALVKKD